MALRRSGVRIPMAPSHSPQGDCGEANDQLQGSVTTDPLTFVDVRQCSAARNVIALASKTQIEWHLHFRPAPQFRHDRSFTNAFERFCTLRMPAILGL